MTRQSITFTNPNNKWLKTQVEDGDYSSKSELINDLVHQARHQQLHIDWIRIKIEKVEKSGFTSKSKDEILAKAKNSTY